MYGTLEVETETGSVLNPKVKFSIDYRLDFDSLPSDELAFNIENCTSLEEILYNLESVSCEELSSNSFSLGEIYDEETDEMIHLEMKIDFIVNIKQEEDISDTGREYNEIFDELFEVIESMRP